MRRWFVISGVLLVGTVVALVLAITRTHDGVPDDVRDCITDLEAAVVRGPDLLGPLRADLVAGEPPRVVESYDIGENPGRLYAGTGYRLLVVTGRNGTPLDDTTPTQAYEDATRFSIVAIERDPLEGALAGCASLSD